ncbi:mitochondrial intermediate peptidase protein [Rutstroemia sp. NJR-2017a WRK4]|nr:mitochondrial intermediate peptidase protein [Rutstroemia sp. NJR-2017a WRK4]
MFKVATPRPWICTRCVKRQIQLHRRIATASTQYHEPQPVPVDTSAPGAKHDDKILRQIFDSPDFWKEFSQSSHTSHNGRSVGLFQNRYLTDPQGFEIFANTSLRRARRIVERVLGASTLEEYKHVARDLDRLSDLLCRVIDLSDFVRSTHPSYEIQAAATRAYAKMFQYMNILNTTTGLDKQLEIAMKTPEIVAQWTEEEMVVADILKKDFAKSAIDLPQAQRERFVDLAQGISEIGQDFVDTMAPAKAVLTFSSSKLKGMDPLLVREHTKWGQTKIPLVGPAAAAAMRTVQDEEVRKEIFMASRTASRDTVKKLEELLTKRAQLARLSRPVVMEEITQLLKAKMANPAATTPVLQPWDRDYYTAQALASVRSRSRNSDFLSAFFSLGTVMQGLSRLFTRLYGIRLVPREPMPGETWNSDVRRLDVISETDGHVAVLYCDLFSRPGKSPNPAHFTLRCSREITPAELAELAGSPNSHLFNTPEEAANDGMATSRASGVLKQLPTIALICDFVTIPGMTSRPALLHFHEVQTLFHEMGHAIHSFLGRTSLQNVSGTRCATDFAELPSVLMERFAADESVLSLFARHYENDQPLPYAMVADKLDLDKRFEGSDAENQIVLSMLDLAYHSSLPLSPSFDSTEVYHSLQRQQGVLPVDPPGTCWQGFFGHLFGYGSTYYSYLFDRVLARRIWQVAFQSGAEGGGINRSNGERMKEEVLKWGGGRDPWKCLAGVLGDGRVESGGQKAMGIVGSWGVKES